MLPLVTTKMCIYGSYVMIASVYKLLHSQELQVRSLAFGRTCINVMKKESSDIQVKVIKGRMMGCSFLGGLEY